MSTLTLQLPETLRDQLNRAAKRAGKTPAKFVRETLEKRFKAAIPSANGKATLYDLSKDLCGKAKGGPRDRASNKKHLDGYGSWKP